MDLISLTSFNGRLGHIKRDQPFSCDADYGNELIKKNMAIEAPKNKDKVSAPKNKSAGSNASSSPAGQASPKKTQKKQSN